MDICWRISFMELLLEPDQDVPDVELIMSSIFSSIQDISDEELQEEVCYRMLDCIPLLKLCIAHQLYVQYGSDKGSPFKSEANANIPNEQQLSIFEIASPIRAERFLDFIICSAKIRRFWIMSGEQNLEIFVRLSDIGIALESGASIPPILENIYRNTVEHELFLKEYVRKHCDYFFIDEIAPPFIINPYQEPTLHIAEIEAGIILRPHLIYRNPHALLIEDASENNASAVFFGSVNSIESSHQDLYPARGQRLEPKDFERYSQPYIRHLLEGNIEPNDLLQFINVIADLEIPLFVNKRKVLLVAKLRAKSARK